MKKRSLDKVIMGAYELGVPLLGVGPMSSNVIEACFELAGEYSFPLIFIASRNQVDLKDFGAGYVGGWNQFDFANNIAKVAEKHNFYDYYLCRDHGGPWQRDEERRKHLDVGVAMDIAKKSFKADIEAGFDLLMIDPTKDPFIVGKSVDLGFVLDKTVELIDYCEHERKNLGTKKISYEIGTEETNGGLTEIGVYNDFIKKLFAVLEDRNLPKPIFAVGQTGTLVKTTRQAGFFDFANARLLSDTLKKYGLYLKEHNADYLDSVSLVLHIPSCVSAANVAPEFGQVETLSYLELCEIEKQLNMNHMIDEPSKLYQVMLKASVKTRKWEKWVEPAQTKLSNGEIMHDDELSLKILRISGHYVLNDEEVINEIKKLYSNLDKNKICGERFVIENIKASVMKYVDCFGMRDLLSKF